MYGNKIPLIRQIEPTPNNSTLNNMITVHLYLQNLAKHSENIKPSEIGSMDSPVTEISKTFPMTNKQKRGVQEYIYQTDIIIRVSTNH